MISDIAHGQKESYKKYIDNPTQLSFPSDSFDIQIARFEIDCPMWIHGFKIHVTEKSRGKFDMHFYGHEAGSYFPQMQLDLIPPVTIKKNRKNDSMIEIELDKPVYINQDQFFLWFDNFKGNVSITKDETPVQVDCKPGFGGSYHTTLLVKNDGIKSKRNQCLQVEVIAEYDKTQTPIFKEYQSENKFLFSYNGSSISWGNVNDSPTPELLLRGNLYEYVGDKFIKIKDDFWEGPKKALAGNAFVDIDNDKDLDILLFGKNTSYLFVNDNGKFIKKELNLPRLPALEGFSFADINYDGYLDLVVVQLWGYYPVPAANYLFVNDKELGFIDITQSLYPEHNNNLNFPSKKRCLPKELSTHLPNENQNKRSRACQFIDFDTDGDMDIYISNYFLEQDELFENKGDGSFVNIMDSLQIDYNRNGYNHTTGLDWADLDNDGDFDLMLPRLAHPRFAISQDHRPTTIFENDNSNFKKPYSTSSIEYEETHAGSFFIDINNDGLQDVVTNTFYDCRYSDIYIQDSAFHFSNRTLNSGLNKLSNTHDGCPVDFNQDGKMDMSLGSSYSFHIYENIDTTQKSNWIKIQLNATTGNHYGIGSLVKVYTKDKILTQQMTSGRGQMMQSESVLHFGLGDEKQIQKIEVNWYGGQKIIYFNPPINKLYTLSENGDIVHNLELD